MSTETSKKGPAPSETNTTMDDIMVAAKVSRDYEEGIHSIDSSDVTFYRIESMDCIIKISDIMGEITLYSTSGLAEKRIDKTKEKTVMISKKFIDACVNYGNKSLELFELKQDIIDMQPESSDPQQKFNAKIRKAAKLFDSGDVKGALHEFEEATKMNGNNGIVFRHIVECYILLKDNKSALKYLNKGIEAGWNEWNVMIKDDTLAPLRLEPEFIKIIDTLTSKDSVGLLYHIEDPIIDAYLKSVKIIL